MRFSIDTSVLFYTFDAEDDRQHAAERLLHAAFLSDCVLTNQVLGEFLNAMRRRHPERVVEARDAASAWSMIFPIVPTTTDHLLAASSIAERHRLQFWDSVILVVARSAGAAWLLTEDMQGGAEIDGVRLLNPFESANAGLLDALLTHAP